MIIAANSGLISLGLVIANGTGSHGGSQFLLLIGSAATFYFMRTANKSVPNGAQTKFSIQLSDLAPK